MHWRRIEKRQGAEMRVVARGYYRNPGICLLVTEVGQLNAVNLLGRGKRNMLHWQISGRMMQNQASQL